MHAFITSRGRITIPVSVRRKLGINADTRIYLEIEGEAGRIILTPITRGYIRGLRGKYRGRGLLKALMNER
jgi:AbrB family looped-hinge helix DNA binding protein